MGKSYVLTSITGALGKNCLNKTNDNMLPPNDFKDMHQRIMREMLEDGGCVMSPGNLLPPGYAYGPLKIEMSDGDDPVKNLIKVTCYREIYKANEC